MVQFTNTYKFNSRGYDALFGPCQELARSWCSHTHSGAHIYTQNSFKKQTILIFFIRHKNALWYCHTWFWWPVVLFPCLPATPSHMYSCSQHSLFLVHVTHVPTPLPLGNSPRPLSRVPFLFPGLSLCSLPHTHTYIKIRS